ncbi:hypothetical protein METHPM2_1880001 [Pseudomonas sp. PM2]
MMVTKLPIRWRLAQGHAHGFPVVETLQMHGDLGGWSDIYRLCSSPQPPVTTMRSESLLTLICF